MGGNAPVPSEHLDSTDLEGEMRAASAVRPTDTRTGVGNRPRQRGRGFQGRRLKLDFAFIVCTS